MDAHRYHVRRQNHLRHRTEQDSPSSVNTEYETEVLRGLRKPSNNDEKSSLSERTKHKRREKSGAQKELKDAEFAHPEISRKPKGMSSPNGISKETVHKKRDAYGDPSYQYMPGQSSMTGYDVPTHEVVRGNRAPAHSGSRGQRAPAVYSGARVKHNPHSQLTTTTKAGYNPVSFVSRRASERDVDLGGTEIARHQSVASEGKSENTESPDEQWNDIGDKTRPEQTGKTIDKTAVKAQRAEVHSECAKLRSERADIKTETAQIRAKRADLRAQKLALLADKAEIRTGQADVKAVRAEVRAENADLKALIADIKAEKAEIKAEKAEIKVQGQVHVKAEQAKVSALGSEALLHAELAEIRAQDTMLKAERVVMKAVAAEVRTRKASLRAEKAEVIAEDAEVKPENLQEGAPYSSEAQEDEEAAFYAGKPIFRWKTSSPNSPKHSTPNRSEEGSPEYNDKTVTLGEHAIAGGDLTAADKKKKDKKRKPREASSNMKVGRHVSTK